MRYYLVVDFEMCRVMGKAKRHRIKNEIIQIGAVMLNESFHIVDDFSTYVKPEFGSVDKFIEDLTGITNDDVKDASDLRAALSSFANWIGQRVVTIMSWSDTDYYQLKEEMQLKKIKHRLIENIMEGWVDFQLSFDKMLGLRRQCALEEAMKISRIHAVGKMHDGLFDAYNTARLFLKIQRHPAFSLNLTPITEYADKEERLSFCLGELFTPELLAQIPMAEEPEIQVIEGKVCKEAGIENWSLYRRLYRIIKGAEAVSDENWSKHVFSREMFRLDLMDFMGGFFAGKKHENVLIGN